MESSPDRENSQGTTESRVADDTVHKHGIQEVSSAEGPAAAGSSASEPLGRMSGSERLEVGSSPTLSGVMIKIFAQPGGPYANSAYPGLIA